LRQKVWQLYISFLKNANPQDVKYQKLLN